jgi:hypothetical protein
MAYIDNYKSKEKEIPFAAFLELHPIIHKTDLDL